MKLGAVSKSGPIAIDLHRIAATDRSVSIVVITGVITGMILANDRISALLAQLSHPIAQGIIVARRTADENRVLRIRIVRHHDIRRRGMRRPNNLLRATKLRIQSVPRITDGGNYRVAQSESYSLSHPHPCVPPVQIVSENHLAARQSLNLESPRSQQLVTFPEQNDFRQFLADVSDTPRTVPQFARLHVPPVEIRDERAHYMVEFAAYIRPQGF